ncbi:GNAT family N-acetyltransferase [Cellulomonas alba]|uniref:GNAT family N-acetyltransferase n=1 Tax=Cellulomonas alba TaxID=3053467 RepID=A0ABT7SIG5_9CELL|nr:GNAT family N-acetyltransferase [Cellulomonas alba]MDM7855968.1 GNAT family N-acetyltransferase [Cellulomonas alba]
MSTLPEGYRISPVTADDLPRFRHVLELGFGFTGDPDTVATIPFSIAYDRAVAVERPDGEYAAIHGSYEFTMPVPGGAVPCSGLTWVSTRPDERRRGLLNAMIDAHFERSLGRGEPVSALYAAEPAIYGRFGYGSAADDVRLTLPRRAALRDVPGSAALTVRLDTIDAARHDDLVHSLHAAASAHRPGAVTRSTPELRARFLADPPAWRNGAEAQRLLSVHTAEGEPRGYALFRRKEDWGPAGPQNKVTVEEVAALDAAAAHRLWGALLDLDLTGTVESPMLPVDDPLLQLLVEPRRATPRLTDNVWVRLLDLPAALEARRYSAPVDVVLDVTDARLPSNAGRWRLTTRDHDATTGWAASVSRTDDDADVALDVRELGAAYLGGRSLEAYARAGLLEERTPGAVAQTAAAFGWAVAPGCSWVF